MSRLVGASIVAITKDPTYGNVYVYLGRERRYPIWNESETWSDFGGGVRACPMTNTPESAETTAAREFWEETACTMHFESSVSFGLNKPHPSHVVYDSFAAMHSALIEHRYVMRINITQPDGAEYVCWVVETPWEPALPMRFAKLTRALRAKRDHDIDSPDIPAHHPAIINDRVNSCFIEKTSIALFSLPILARALEERNAICRRHNRIEYLRGTFAIRLRVVLSHLGYIGITNPLPMLRISWALGNTPSPAENHDEIPDDDKKSIVRAGDGGDAAGGLGKTLA